MGIMAHFGVENTLKIGAMCGTGLRKGNMLTI